AHRWTRAPHPIRTAQTRPERPRAGARGRRGAEHGHERDDQRASGLLGPKRLLEAITQPASCRLFQGSARTLPGGTLRRVISALWIGRTHAANRSTHDTYTSICDSPVNATDPARPHR